MAQIVTITNPLTGQPTQVDQLNHTAQEIDDAIARALPGGAIDITLQKKADLFTTLQMDGVDRNVEVSSAGWHRLIEFNGYVQSAILHIKHQYYSNGPCDMLVYVSCMDKYAVHILSATSYLNNVITIDDLRLVSNSTTGKYYLDIHYKYNGINGIGVDIIGTTAQADWEVDINRMNLESVDTLPDGETVVKTAEWENPPMLLGVEYRTTERHNEQPVYTMLLQFDNLTSNQSYGPGGEIIRVSAECQYPDTSGKWIPLHNFSTGTENKTYPVIDFNSNYNRTLIVMLDSSSPCLGKSCRVQMWYTK